MYIFKIIKAVKNNNNFKLNSKYKKLKLKKYIYNVTHINHSHYRKLKLEQKKNKCIM